MLFVVPKSFHQERLDVFLARHAKQFSRSQIEKFIKDGTVKINNHYVVTPSFKIRKNDRVVLLEEKIISKNGDALKPNKTLLIKIIYEDNNLLVIEKPAGILTHPTFYDKENTIANWLVGYYPPISAVGDNILRPGLAHRLDKDTSGLLAIAKNQATFLWLKKQFASRLVEKKYLALVIGIPNAREGVIDYPITTWLGKTVKRKVIKEDDHIFGRVGKHSTEALTIWRVKEKIGDSYALLEVEPKTGRTHQIRAHLAAIGHPIVGDALYGGKKANLELQEVKRQFLHAYYLRFSLPEGEAMAFEIDLPADLEKVLQKVRKFSTMSRT